MVFARCSWAQESVRSSITIIRKKVEIGGGLIKAGLLLQIILFGGFVAVIYKFHVNVNRANLTGRWTTVLYVLYSSAFLISVRCLYRVVEYFEGITGAIYRNENYFHVFEASLMLINVIIINVFHPGRYLPKGDKTILNEHGQEVESETGGWEDNRPFIVTLFDPFNIAGLIDEYRNKKKAEKAAASYPAEEKQATV